MGGFYANYTVRGASQQAVAGALRGRRAMVSPARNGCVVAFDEVSDEQDTEQIAALSLRLSRDLGCPVLAVVNHDDDVLWFSLAVNGKTVDTYDSNPAYFDDLAPSEPGGGDAALLARVFGVGDVARIEAVLRASGDGAYAFASEQHSDLVDALGLPRFAVGTAFATFVRGEAPPDLTAAEMIQAPGADVLAAAAPAEAHPDAQSSGAGPGRSHAPRFPGRAAVVLGAVAIAVILERACG